MILNENFWAAKVPEEKNASPFTFDFQVKSPPHTHTQNKQKQNKSGQSD